MLRMVRVVIQACSSKFILIHWRLTQINLRPIYFNLSGGQEVSQHWAVLGGEHKEYHASTDNLSNIFFMHVTSVKR